ncbi:hypothetical protein S245_062468, partial [Arachis hypogaea]
NEGDGPNVVLAKPTSWVAGGEERTWGLRPGRSVTKRAIPFRARQNGRARIDFGKAGVRAN